MKHVFLAVFITAAFHVDVRGMINPQNEREWMLAVKEGGWEATDVQKLIGRALVGSSSVESLMRWCDACDILDINSPDLGGVNNEDLKGYLHNEHS